MPEAALWSFPVWRPHKSSGISPSGSRVTATLLHNRNPTTLWAFSSKCSHSLKQCVASESVSVEKIVRHDVFAWWSCHNPKTCVVCNNYICICANINTFLITQQSRAVLLHWSQSWTVTVLHADTNRTKHFFLWLQPGDVRSRARRWNVMEHSSGGVYDYRAKASAQTHTSSQEARMLLKPSACWSQPSR